MIKGLVCTNAHPCSNNSLARFSEEGVHGFVCLASTNTAICRSFPGRGHGREGFCHHSFPKLSEKRLTCQNDKKADAYSLQRMYRVNSHTAKTVETIKKNRHGDKTIVKRVLQHKRAFLHFQTIAIEWRPLFLVFFLHMIQPDQGGRGSSAFAHEKKNGTTDPFTSSLRTDYADRMRGLLRC